MFRDTDVRWTSLQTLSVFQSEYYGIFLVMLNWELLDPKAFIVECKGTFWKKPLSHREWRKKASSKP
jgi:hypothetical protein